MRAMRCKAADFDQVIGTLTQWGEVEVISIPSATKICHGVSIDMSTKMFHRIRHNPSRTVTDPDSRLA